MPDRDEPVADIAATVMRYLAGRPSACDTAEGIVQWWLARQRFDDTLAAVSAALASLVARGELEASVGADGQTLYRRPRPSRPATNDREET